MPSRLLQSLQGIRRLAPRRGIRVQSGGKSWELAVGVAVERRTLVSPELPPIARDYLHMCQTQEAELSLHSDTEVIRARELEEVEARAEGREAEAWTLDLPRDQLLSTRDLHDRAKEELNSFIKQEKPLHAPLTSDDPKELRNDLRRPLVLLTLQKFPFGPGGSVWGVPQGRVEEGQTLRAAVDGLLRQLFGEQARDVQVLGNAPVGLHSETYSARLRPSMDTDGQKTFLFKALVKDGVAELGPSAADVEDFVWEDHDEVARRLARVHKRYAQDVAALLVE